MLLAKEKHNQQ